MDTKLNIYLHTQHHRYLREAHTYTGTYILNHIHIEEVHKKKQGPAIYLSLDENIRKTCCDIKVKHLNSDDGVDIVLCKLKSLFAKDINQAAFIAYEKFEMFKRPANINIVVNEFERLYNNIKNMTRSCLQEC